MIGWHVLTELEWGNFFVLWNLIKWVSLWLLHRISLYFCNSLFSCNTFHVGKECFMSWGLRLCCLKNPVLFLDSHENLSMCIFIHLICSSVTRQAYSSKTLVIPKSKLPKVAWNPVDLKDEAKDIYLSAVRLLSFVC